MWLHVQALVDDKIAWQLAKPHEHFNLTIFRTSAEKELKEATSREIFAAEFIENTKKTSINKNAATAVLHSAIKTGFPNIGLLNAFNVFHSHLSARSEWVLILQPDAILANPLNKRAFNDILKAYASAAQWIILFEHCGQVGAGTLLIHRMAGPLIERFLKVQKADSEEKIWTQFLKMVGKDVTIVPSRSRSGSNDNNNNNSKHQRGAGVSSIIPLEYMNNEIFTCESDWLSLKMPTSLLEDRKFTIDSRTSPDTIKMITDYFYGDLPINELTKERIRKGQLQVLNDSVDGGIENQIDRDGTVIFVDIYKVNEFVKNIGPKIKKSFVLVSGDGDECDPECVSNKEDTENFVNSPYLKHWYAMNCQGYEIAPQKMSCIPIGVKQWDNQRESLQKLYENGIGLKNGLQWAPVNLKAKNPNYVLLSFTISSNSEVRQPVHDMFCKSGAPKSREFEKIMNCMPDSSLGQYEFHRDMIEKSRFVISPHGHGLDCYRTYEALFMNVIPIVKTSTLDPLYEKLPVLILKEWEDLTVELMEDTEKQFSEMEWDFRSLYADYWYHKVRSHL
ncbi:hypothetical protein HK100_004556 [Physocladia obscura]|uniref:Exostosin GT47 domain-containing protein n=1 Tax=Physocladia obscura TaxID=109957 RepID=A0AAD5SSR8_9FUNG|nr:hypothetical protein HK100_004556 [Physocladia obscura]